MTFNVAGYKLTDGDDFHALLARVGKCSFDETTAHTPPFERLGHFSMGKDQSAIAPFIHCDRELSVNGKLITAFRRIVSNIAHMAINLSPVFARYSLTHEVQHKPPRVSRSSMLEQMDALPCSTVWGSIDHRTRGDLPMFYNQYLRQRSANAM